MKVAFWWVPLTVVLVALAVIVYYEWETTEEKPPPVELPVPPASDEPRYPVPATPREPQEPVMPLPALDESDEAIQGSLEELFRQETVREILNPENIIRNVVVTVDNLPREKLGVQMRPVKPAMDAFRTSGTEAAITMNPDNYARYQPFVELARVADAKQVTRLYFRFYPLFQQAYDDLGDAPRNFNDRMVEVIDHLLATPEVQGPIRLMQPKVFYQFADPELEAMSAGQKILIRMGSENAAVIKAKLQEIRAELVTQD